MNKVSVFAALAFLASSAAIHASPFPGTIELAVDATDGAHGIFTAHETILVSGAGDVTLLYPQWEIGSHAPTASVAELAGLVIRVDGVRVEWRRDPLDVYAFQVPVAAGARQITVDLQFLPPLAAKWLRADMVGVQWHRMLLYPAGWDVGDIPIEARLKLAEGLKTASSLAGQDTAEGHRFDVTSLENLVDAPVYAARHERQIDLAPGAATPVRLDLVADSEADLVISPEETERLRQLIVQAGKVFGPAPYRHYDAIVTLTDDLPAGGIEHLEEGENFLPAGYFLDPAPQLENRDLIARAGPVGKKFRAKSSDFARNLAGLAPGMRIRTVNGRAFLSAALKAAVAASSSEPIVFEVEMGGAVRTVTIPYHGGLRYPRLERIAGVPDRLTPLLAPRR